MIYFYFQKIDIRRYIKSPNWIANKGATVNPKNEKDNKSFQWSITARLNYNEIKRKYFQHIEKLKWVDADFSSDQRGWKEFEQNNTLIALNVLFVSHDSKNINLTYKLKYNYKRKNQVILLKINDEAKNCYYFAVKNLLDSLGWLRDRKEAII